MCTLSWQVRDESLTLIFNRDERLSRPEAHPPEVEDIEGVRVLAPKDPEGGGTWLAANEFGMVVCLMNNYRNGTLEPSDREYRSRGLLVRSLSSFHDLHELRSSLADIDMQAYRPFHLVVFPGVFAPIEWQWNGRVLTETVGPPPVMSSAGLLPDYIPKKRIRLFRKVTDDFMKTITGEKQLAMHRSRRPWPPFMSIAMKWRGRGTVSLTHVTIESDAITMGYQPGDPVTTSHPMVTSRLVRIASPKPERQILPCDPYPENPIDVIKVMSEKNPAMLASLPGIARAGLRVIAREKIINNRLNRARKLTSNLFAARVLHHTGVRGHLTPAAGALPPPESRPLFVANHPTGGLDGILLLHWLSTYYPGIRLIVNDLLWNLHHMRPYIVPVDVFGDNRNTLKTVMDAFQGQDPLLVFPSGKTARKQNGELTEAPWQKNSIKMAVKYQRIVVPVRIDGYNSRLFYGVAWMRNLLRIPLNLEMLLLSHEFFSPRWKDFGLTVGEPLSPDQVRALGDSDEERAQALRRICVQQGNPSTQ